MPKAGRDVLPKVGSLVEGPAAYGHLSGQANLVLLDASGRHPGGPLGGGRRDRSDRARRALEVVGLGDVGRRPVRAYSLGMRQRLGLAAAMLRQPELLVLDEPTNGLDPQGIREVRTLLQQLHEAGTTIFLSSHLLAEVDQLCTRIGLLDRGRLVIQESLSTLRAPTGRTVVDTSDVALAKEVLGPAVELVEGERLVIRSADPARVNARLVAAGVAVRELGPERRTLEQVIEERTSARRPGEVAR
jgi:ABC-2 type transport system ATP-binding protein